MKFIFKTIELCEMSGEETHENKVIGQQLNKSQGFDTEKASGITISVMICTKSPPFYLHRLLIPFNIRGYYVVPPE